MIFTLFLINILCNLYSYSGLDAFKDIEVKVPKISKITSIKQLEIKTIIPSKFASIHTVQDDRTFYVKDFTTSKPIFGKVYLVFTKDAEGKIWPKARAVYVGTHNSPLGGQMHKFVVYRLFLTIEAGNRIAYLGDPLDDFEKAEVQHILMDYANLDRETQDMYFGLMSVRLNYGFSKITGTSNTDVNSFKNTKFYSMYGLGFRWWPFFAPMIALDLDYRQTSSIKTVSFYQEDKISRISMTSIGLMYRRNLFKLPTFVSAKYYWDSFGTTNTDDWLLSSKNTGISFAWAIHFPYKMTLIPMSFINFIFHDFEVGAGYTPIIFVKDIGYVRGQRSSATSYNMHGDLLFNFESDMKALRWIQNLFFGATVSYTSYNLAFTGATEGIEPDTGEKIPEGTINTEKYIYYGMTIKYEFADPFGGK